MDFYPPLNVDQIFDKSLNDFPLSRFGLNKSLSKSRSHHHVETIPHDVKYYRSKSFSDIYSQKIVRKLGLNERIFHGHTDFNRSYIYRTVIITSEINLYENIETVYKSIDEWKSMHPLLRCKVYSNNDKDKYFVYVSNEKVKSNDNLHFLTYIPNHTKSCDDVWKLLVERETTIPLSGEHGLLWRLTFFHVKDSSTSWCNLHFYAVILTFDHSIMDGRSSYTSLLQLFSLIENNFNKIENLVKEKLILPPREDIFKTFLHESNKYQAKMYTQSPHFLNIQSSNSYIKLKNLSQEEEEFGMIYTYDQKPVISVKELIEISKQNNSKFRTLIIQRTDFDKIVQKCKENQVKLTIFINMCLVQALRMIYEKYDNDLVYITEEPVIHFTTNISLREFKEYMSLESDKNGSIGCYIGLAFNSFEKNLNYGVRNWSKNFWTTCRNESKEFHEKLKNREFLYTIQLPDIKKEHDEFFYHFGNSNLGIMESSISERKMIRIKQTFATGKYSKENFLCWLSNLMATVDGQLCWTISFNTCFIKQEIVNLLINNLTKVIKELIK